MLSFSPTCSVVDAHPQTADTKIVSFLSGRARSFELHISCTEALFPFVSGMRFQINDTQDKTLSRSLRVKIMISAPRRYHDGTDRTRTSSPPDRSTLRPASVSVGIDCGLASTCASAGATVPDGWRPRYSAVKTRRRRSHRRMVGRWRAEGSS